MTIVLLNKTTTKQNSEINFFELKSSDKNAKNILFLGVMHGEEPQGKFLIEKFMNEIREKDLKFKNNLYFLPCLNPDGMKRGNRGNANNVDLNRNFDTKNYEITTFDDDTTSGKSANSEIETKFLANIINNYNFSAILSFHAPFEVVNFDGEAKNIAQKISEITGYPIQEDIGYPTPGSFGTYCGVERKIPVITLEVSEKLSDDELWEQNRDVFLYFAQL